MKSHNDCPFLVCSQCWLVPSDLIISAALLTRLPSFSDITLETFLIQSMVAQRPFSKLLPARPSSSLPLIEFVSHRSPVYHNTYPPCPLASHPFGSSSFLLLVAFSSRTSILPLPPWRSHDAEKGQQASRCRDLKSLFASVSLYRRPSVSHL